MGCKPVALQSQKRFRNKISRCVSENQFITELLWWHQGNNHGKIALCHEPPLLNWKSQHSIGLLNNIQSTDSMIFWVIVVNEIAPNPNYLMFLLKLSCQLPSLKGSIFTSGFDSYQSTTCSSPFLLVMPPSILSETKHPIQHHLLHKRFILHCQAQMALILILEAIWKSRNSHPPTHSQLLLIG